MKWSARKDKREYYVERLAAEAERAAELKDMKTVLVTPQKLRGDREINQEIPVNAEDG